MKARNYLGILLALVIVVCLFTLAPSASAAETSLIDSQLNMIFADMNTWKQDSSTMQWYYAVTDLDRDARLEIVAAAQHPVDRSTNLKVWEVNETLDALEECTLALEEDESFPDILTDNADTYYVTTDGTWSYMFYDNIVLSDDEVYTLKCSVKLVDGVISYDSYGVQHTVVTNGIRTVSHTNNLGFSISAEQYNASGVDAFTGAARSNTNFDWFVFEDASVTRLTNSYSVFMGMKEPTEVFPVPKPAALEDPSATPTPMPTLAPVSPAPLPTYLMITKNPTNENRKVGDTAWFVSCANAFDSLSWTLVAPNGGEYSVKQFRSVFPKAGVSGEYSTTLGIGNVEKDMNNWGAYCTFYYNGQTARTSTAYILVKDIAPTPTPTTPIGETGEYYGTVTATSFSTVTVNCPGADTYEIPLSICTVTGQLDVGADATVYWVRVAGSRGVTPTACSIRGKEPAPQPVYGSMSGTAYHDTAFTVYVVLQNGNGLHLDGSLVTIIGGSDIEGAPCVVYYTDYPSESTIYWIEIYGRDPQPEPEPEPEPEPVPIYLNPSGSYAADRINMTISGSRGWYNVYATWGSGATSSVEWNLNGDFDANNGMYYSGTKTTTEYDSDGNMISQISESVSGTINYYPAGAEYVTWSEAPGTNLYRIG